jgi:hypothetical protein
MAIKTLLSLPDDVLLTIADDLLQYNEDISSFDTLVCIKHINRYSHFQLTSFSRFRALVMCSSFLHHNLSITSRYVVPDFVKINICNRIHTLSLCLASLTAKDLVHFLLLPSIV